ncbi:MAG TPA: hypothetical protein VF622_03880, partial [Segetibacter sp.]
GTLALSQKVIYSEPDRSDLRQTNFEIIGKVGGNYLVYKNNRDVHEVSVYNNDMKQKDRVALDFLPDRIINADFLAYPDFSYMIYQFQKKNIVYCMAAKLNDSGKIVGKPVQLDTTSISFFASNKLYSFVHSDDKQYISIFKINSKNEKNHLLTTSLFNKDLRLLQKDFMSIAMPERNDLLTQFHVDNDGNLIFTRAVQSQQEDVIQKLFLLIKPLYSSNLVEQELNLKNIYLDDIRLKVDNFNKRYIITSMFMKRRMGNLDGLYVGIWDRGSSKLVVSNTTPFDDKLRMDAKGQNAVKAAFNDYFLRNLIVKKDGGFLMAAESFYSTGRGGGLNRNLFYGNPFLRSSDFYSYTPYAYSYPWSRFNNLSSALQSRYHAENIAVFSFDGSGRLNWSNVINKDQYDDDVDVFIGYQMVNTGDQLHFLYNKQEKRTQLLSDQSISPEGQLTRVPTLKNLDRGFEFMPRLGKQVGSRQIIFPCMYRNYLCFAKLEL